MKRPSLYLASAVAALTPLMISAPVHAAGALLYLSPGSNSVSQGNFLTVNVRENSGSTPVNAVQAKLTYPANLLSFVSMTSSSAYGVTAQNSGGAGTIQIARGALTAVTGDQLVASVRFKALSGSGTATISFGAGSEVDNDGNNVTGSTAGGSYDLAPAPLASPSGPTDTIAPIISNQSVSNITSGSVQVNWTTSEPASSEVDYGPTQSYGLTADDPALVTDHKVVIKSALLAPAQTYHYMVKSADPSGNQSSGPDGSFTVKGATLSVTVENQNNKLLQGASVSFGGQTAVTNKNGLANLGGLRLGKQSGTITYHHKTTAVRADVEIDSSEDDGQGVTFKIETGPSLWPVVTVITAVALLAAGAVWYRRRRSLTASIAHLQP